MHRRSKHKLQERRIRSLIFANTFIDKTRCETVCLVNRQEILEALAGPVELSLVPDVVKGEVLVDSRGDGSFQGGPPVHERMFGKHTPYK